MGTGFYSYTNSDDQQVESRHRSDDIVDSKLMEVDGHLYFIRDGFRHPVKVMTTTAIVRVGCVSLTRKAWETLKRKIDGVPS